MKRKNFYRLSNKRKAEVFQYGMKRRWNWKHLYKHYKQPPWCFYPDALSGEMGCWTLIGKGNETKGRRNDKCNTCPESKYFGELLLPLERNSSHKGVTYGCI